MKYTFKEITNHSLCACHFTFISQIGSILKAQKNKGSLGHLWLDRAGWGIGLGREWLGGGKSIQQRLRTAIVDLRVSVNKGAIKHGGKGYFRGAIPILLYL